MSESLEWSRELVEVLRLELNAGTMELLDMVSEVPGRQFTRTEIAEHLELEDETAVNGLLSQLTHAARGAGIPQEEEHSWFLEWEKRERLYYWLGQQRSDWWRDQPDRGFWAFMSNPKTGYDPLQGLELRETAWRETKGKDIRIGDRVAFWKTKGGEDFPKKRGVVALGEVISSPEMRSADSFPEIDQYADSSSEEERVEVRYVPINDYLWFKAEADTVIENLSVARAHGGSVFSISPDEWERILIRAGGWQEDHSRTGQGWGPRELRLTVASYLKMLGAELRGQKYSKTEYRKRLVPKLNGRSEGAVEFKHQNISAVLSEEGLPFIQGYKPRSNYQAALADEVLRQVEAARELRKLFAEAASLSPSDEPEDTSTSVFTEPPEGRSEAPSRGRRPARKIDYAKREAKNSALGRQGEEFVCDVERNRLREVGREDLAERVKWVADEDGDGLGYDVLSFDETGKKIYVEVKTTRLGIDAGFYLSRNELERAHSLGRAYRLYRVFDFGRKPRIYVLTGPIDESCLLEPDTYRAWVRE